MGLGLLLLLTLDWSWSWRYGLTFLCMFGWVSSSIQFNCFRLLRILVVLVLGCFVLLGLLPELYLFLQLDSLSLFCMLRFNFLLTSGKIPLDDVGVVHVAADA